MKNFTSTLLLLLAFFLELAGQTQPAFNYQAVIHNADGTAIANQEVSVDVEILQGSVTGTSVFSETHSVTTTPQGIITLTIGSVESLSGIDWGASTYFIKISVNDTEIGTSQLLSVPFALHAKTAENLTNEVNETDPVFTAWDKSTGVEITESQISDLQNYLTDESDPAVSANFDFSGAANGDLLQYNGTKWVKVTPGYLTSYTETDPTFTAWDKTTGISITESQISDLQNYLTDESDPTVSANFDFSGAANGDLLQYNGTKWVKVTPGYLTSYTETDPTFTAWNKTTGISITESQISDLQNYLTDESDPAVSSNFDFAGAANGDLLQYNGTKWVKVTPSYLTSYTETDPTFTAWDKTTGISITESQISNLQNYLKDESDPAVSSNFDFSGAANGDLLQYNGTKWVKVTPSYLTTYTETQNLSDVAAINNSVNTQLKNVTDPTDAQDAATKYYADEIDKKVNKLTWVIEDNENRGIIKDIDGNIYKTIKIGSQIWMAENLKTTKYYDGTDIPLITDNASWGSLSTPGYCWYNNDKKTYGDSFGALYNWFVIETGLICPLGWHVPTDAEWYILENYIDPTINNPNVQGWRGTDGGTKLKETYGWMNDGNGTNDYEFSANPSGYRGCESGNFYSIEISTLWWCNTMYDGSNSWFRNLNWGKYDINRNWYPKKYGYSVRCLKD